MKKRTPILKQLLFVVLFFIFNIGYSQADTLNSKLLKPLDKNSPYYFCKKTFEGVIEEEGYKEGEVLNGEFRLYNLGKLLNIFTYKNDAQTGYYAAYYPTNGNIHITGYFIDSNKEGVWKEYDVNGKLISTKKYLNDEQIE